MLPVSEYTEPLETYEVSGVEHVSLSHQIHQPFNNYHY